MVTNKRTPRKRKTKLAKSLANRIAGKSRGSNVSNQKSDGDSGRRKIKSDQRGVDSISNLFSQLRQILPALERHSYFELDKRALSLVRQFEGNRDDIPQIQAWTFRPHPKVIDALFGPERKLRRYFLTIDALRSAIYDQVRDFLQRQTSNVTSYYTGGWADFLCDIQMVQVDYEQFIEELREVLKPGVETILGKGRVNDAISYFEVTEQIIICGRPYRSIPIPSSEAIEEVLSDRLRFETVHRNYRSQAVLQLFGKSERKLKAYLSKLKADGIIVSYHVVFDIAFGIAREFVPMSLSSDREGPILKLLDDSRKVPNLLKPVQELLKVRPISVSEVADKEVNYFFINRYAFPGEKTIWKQTIYDHATLDVNISNYPIESTLSEGPVSLSDLPEFLSKAKLYQSGLRDRRVFVGWAAHPLLPSLPEVALPLSCFTANGVVLGEPGSGKTSIDFLLASEASEFFKTVIMIDFTGGLESKISSMPERLIEKLKIINIEVDNEHSLSEVLSRKGGFYLLKISRTDTPIFFAKLMAKISASADSVSSNEPRLIHTLLFVEEANEAIGIDQNNAKENIQRLQEFLVRTHRKGWSVWLSTQHATSLGYDEESASKVLELLQNRIILRISSKKEVDIILHSFRRDGCSKADLHYFGSAVGELPAGTALCRSIELREGRKQYLPLLRIKFRPLTMPETLVKRVYEQALKVDYQLSKKRNNDRA